MYTYPSIQPKIISTPVYAFDKLDGSSIRAEWSRKNGFYKFGTRKRLLASNEPMLGEAVDLIWSNYADDLSRIFLKERYENATAFFEFFRESSFAGNHVNERHNVILFDVYKHKHGLVEPREFLKVFGSKVSVPDLLYRNAAKDCRTLGDR